MNNPATYDVWAEQFKANFELQLQQKDSKFGETVTRAEPVKGKSATIMNVLEPFEAEEGGDDIADTKWTVPEWGTRWAYPKVIRASVPVTQTDKLHTLDDPQNPLVLAMMAAFNRKLDDIIIAAAFRDVTGGADQDKTYSFDAAKHVIDADVGAAGTGWNWAKMIAIQQKLLEAEVEWDEEEVFVGISPEDHGWLMSMAETKNEDFKRLGIVLQNGIVREFLGMKTRISNRLQRIGTGAAKRYRNPVWTKSGMGLQPWLDPKIRISERPDKNYTIQIYCEARWGAARLMEGKVLDVRTPCSL